MLLATSAAGQVAASRSARHPRDPRPSAKPLAPQPVLVRGIVPPQVEDFACSCNEPDGVCASPDLPPGPSPSKCQHSQRGCRPPEAALCPASPAVNDEFP